jgi:2-amino-4-hydroxy-6-hydroxymethyldihydropteridine diphosphokinase
MSVYVGLGSNVGSRRGHLRTVLHALDADPNMQGLRSSSLYESAHVGPGDQRDHLNLCVEFESSLAPPVLLELLQDLERAAGRAPGTHGEPRPLDLDLLLYGDCISEDPRCTLPHPRMGGRRFVLEPLQELLPGLRWPGQTLSLEQLLAVAEIRGQELRRVAAPGWWKEEFAAWTA